MLLFPNAKINIGLQLHAKRPDGYHELETIFYPIDWCDVLELLPTEEMLFTSSGISIPGEGNLCLDAYHLLKSDFDISPVHIHLHKVIPIGAGLGGGSSDAAFTLKGLNDLFSLGLTSEQLKVYAIKLGADCPFFIENKPMLAKGIGELLSPIDLDLSAYYIFVQNPGIHVSTKNAYAGVTPKASTHSLTDLIGPAVEHWQLKNDFEASVFKQFPAIHELKQSLYDAGAAYAAMSGSGSSVFALFKEKVNLEGFWQECKSEK